MERPYAFVIFELVLLYLMESLSTAARSFASLVPILLAKSMISTWSILDWANSLEPERALDTVLKSSPFIISDVSFENSASSEGTV